VSLTASEPHSARRGKHKSGDTTAAGLSSEQTVRGAYRVAGVSRGHIKPVETSRANRKVWKTHPGEGPNGATCRMAGVNESG
jgi:hypothetical protein